MFLIKSIFKIKLLSFLQFIFIRGKIGKLFILDQSSVDHSISQVPGQQTTPPDIGLNFFFDKMHKSMNEVPVLKKTS